MESQKNPDCTFNPEIFTDVYWKLLEADTRFVINYGGADSSKSWSQAQREVISLITSYTNTLVLRKIAKESKESTYAQIKKVIEVFDEAANFDFLSEWEFIQNEIKYLSNRNRFIFTGLDDVAKLKSIVGIERIWGEEASEYTIDDHYEINRRPRAGTKPQITYTFNPILETHWLKTHFFDIPEIKEKTTIIFSTIDDNKFAPEYRKQVLEDYKLYDLNQYNVYRWGKWGKPGTKRPFIYAFKDRHVGHGLIHDSKLTVHLSFDFNVSPITAIAVQHGYKGSRLWIHVVKEFRLPSSDIYELTKEIRTYFYETTYFLITGDATGSSRSAMTKGHTNYYTIIKSELRLTNANFKVSRSNPSIKDSRALVNTLFMRTDFLIDDSCRYLLDDLRYVESDEHGLMDKKKAEADGMGHLMDTLRYYCYKFHNKFLKHIPGKLLN